MAEVKIEVPDGEYCGTCRFLQRGTVICNLFDTLLKENEDYTDKYKCEECPKE